MTTAIDEIVCSRLMKDGLRHVDPVEIFRVGGKVKSIGASFTELYGVDLNAKWAEVVESVARMCSENGYSVFSDVNVTATFEDVTFRGTIRGTFEVSGPVRYSLRVMVT